VCRAALFPVSLYRMDAVEQLQHLCSEDAVGGELVLVLIVDQQRFDGTG
jgi:hypothetical protein